MPKVIDDAPSARGNGEHFMGKLTTGHIIVLIIANASPLGAIIGMGPLAFMMGGAGLPLAFLLAGVVILCFALCYAQLIKHIPGEGAFYKYIQTIFGHRVGVASAFMAAFSYLMLTISLASATGYFTNLLFQSYGVNLGWEIWAVIAFVLVNILGAYSADIGASVLSWIVILEFLLLLVVDIAIGKQSGAATFPLQVFSSDVISHQGFSVCLMAAFMSFIGFEAASLYSGEAKDADSSVPKALLSSVLVVAVFYFITSWALVGAVGIDNVQNTARSMQGEMVINIIKQYVGGNFSQLTNILFCNSSLVCYLALHNASARYVRILATNGYLPEGLGKINVKTNAPVNASLFVSLFVAAALIVPAALGIDPYVVLSGGTAAVSTFGILLLQALVAFGCVIFFRKRKHARNFSTFLAPILAGAGLLVAASLIAENFTLLSGFDNKLINLSPGIVGVVFITGCWIGKRRRTE
ncbi:APC family permease [Erwinia sp. V71]|uniref:APC family permease n=1 Tax=Erwinia sp. V71 TaxID=3369424 RepID=UPI003F640DBE